MTFSRNAALLVIFGAALTAQGQKVTLRLNPPVGKSYVYAVTTSIKSTGGQAMDMKQSMTVTTKATKNSGGKVTIESTITNAKVTGTGPMAANSAAMAKNLNGRKTTTVMDSQGKPIGNDANKMMQQMVQGGLSNMHFFPTQPVGVGSKWSNTMDLTSMMPKGMKVTGGKMPITMLLKKFESRSGKRIAIVDMTMKTTMSMTGAQPNQSMTINMNSLGTAWIDVATGLPVETKTNATTVTSFGKMKMNQQISSSMKLK